jgi:hypothetical protein
MELALQTVESPVLARRLLRVRRKLHEVQEQARRGTLRARVPCGTDHQYRLNPKLDEEAVAAFERRHGIRLPEDYRAFLVHFGDGGAGPYCGVLPLEQWHECVGDVVARVPRPLKGYLASLSPLSPNQPQPLQSEWQADLKLYEWHPYQGGIAVGHQGSTYYTLLIVAGEARGRIAYVDTAGEPPYFVRNLDFLGWYERWLEETLAGKNMVWFGFD